MPRHYILCVNDVALNYRKIVSLVGVIKDSWNTEDRPSFPRSGP
jgi:hypothetical protein